jgi:hypothetical protein
LTTRIATTQYPRSDTHNLEQFQDTICPTWMKTLKRSAASQAQVLTSLGGTLE